MLLDWLDIFHFLDNEEINQMKTIELPEEFVIELLESYVFREYDFGSSSNETKETLKRNMVKTKVPEELHEKIMGWVIKY